MRSVVVDLVREKAGASAAAAASRHVTLNTGIGDGAPAAESRNPARPRSARRAAALNERMAQVVEMRYFAGLTEPEIADALGVTERTVRRDWEKARLLLAEMLGSV